MNSIEVLRKFVAGEISPKEFEKIIYADKELEGFLFGAPPIMPYAKDNELYLFLISSNYRSLGDVLNVQDALHRFLKMRGVEVTRSKNIENEINEKHKLLPKWLRISDETYSEIRQLAEGLEGEEFASFMKEQIKKRFICLGKPPRWLQDAFWPNLGGEPMIFVGQLDISKIRHDTSYVYVFPERWAVHHD